MDRPTAEEPIVQAPATVATQRPGGGLVRSGEEAVHRDGHIDDHFRRWPASDLSDVSTVTEPERRVTVEWGIRQRSRVYPACAEHTDPQLNSGPDWTSARRGTRLRSCF
jgi:hypothetical protein